ncbi:hypothetical protein FTW19_16215 [Terriglobus albidus]|uniref:BIG2 domain-containing protein n=1 Tax=Terriglobus albidus TaxID=1592106 RepID=A0A5B9EH67_9BACT|nr:hypothetical protein [Terriglobus albidus]QEE29406.1 hypothetical protein FTW19_16215 [Terriglobus albidus]
MRRFVLLAFLVMFFIPVSVSITGCSRNKSSAVYCNGGDSGMLTGQITTINLEPRLTGVSLSSGQMGSVGTASATDCKGNSVSVSNFTYASSDTTHTLVDVNPSTGRLCAGSWNRNNAGGIADYTYCNTTGLSGTATVTASAGGATSNTVTVYVHPIIGSVALTGASQADCVSQGKAITLAADAFDTSGNSISSSIVGKFTFAAQTSGIVTIDENGVATAAQPGSTLITASISNATSTAGYFSTCPPTSIALNIPGSSSTSVSVNPNTTQPITATVLDKNNTTLTNLTLTYVSTTPRTIPAATGSVTPTFPGAAAITAFCLPPTCNPSPTDRVGLFGNGKPVASNNINVTTTGLSSNYLYLASTQSQYVTQIDMTTGNLGATLRLPYVPNSMQLSTDGAALYLGTSNEIITLNATSNAITKEDTSISGRVISVSPDSGTVVITDPSRKLIYLYTSAGVVSSTYGGVATRAAWSTDSTTVYITTADNQLITYSTPAGWHVIDNSGLTAVNDVAVTVPSVGAYFAGTTATVGHTYCHKTTYSGTSVSSIEYFPIAGGTASTVAAPLDRIAATNDGAHILGARMLSGVPQITDIGVSMPIGGSTQGGACPTASGAVPNFIQNSLNTYATTASGTAVTSIVPASNSTVAFVTYSAGTTGSPVIPAYFPSTNTVSNIALATTSGKSVPTAPVSGVFSADDATFFVSTAGDNQVHLITKGTTSYSDTRQLDPKLPAFSGSGYSVPDLIAAKPRTFQ